MANMTDKIANKPQSTIEVQTNLSTNSTDSGVIMIDNNNLMYSNNIIKSENMEHIDNIHTHENRKKLLENIKMLTDNNCCMHKNNIILNSTHNILGEQNSPTASLRSLSISIVSIDANTRDSSVVDSDFEAELESEKYVIHKLGEQTTYAPDSADIPRLNNGLKVVSQLVSPQGENSEPSELSTLKNNNNGPSHIGTIALSNSSDVTFGDKHFYEGPVTIQQFLIDSRNKQKEKEQTSQTNKAFDLDTKQYTNNATIKNSNNLTANGKYLCSCFGIELTRRTTYFTTIVLIILSIAAILFYMLTVGNLKSTSKQWGEGDDTRLIYPNITNIDYTEIVTPNGTLRLIKRDAWSAREPVEEFPLLKFPIPRVIVAHTASAPCQSDSSCIFDVQFIQNFHMDSRNWSDIGYNFLIGGEGQVFVGRDWYYMGAHTLGYNNDSIGIAFMGTYISVAPTEIQLKALKLIMEWGVIEKKLAADYCLYGARQMMATESPGTMLYQILKTFEHWTNKL